MRPSSDVFEVTSSDCRGGVPDDALVKVGCDGPWFAKHALRGGEFGVGGEIEVGDRRLRDGGDRAVGVDAHVLDSTGDDLRVAGAIGAAVGDVVLE